MIKYNAKTLYNCRHNYNSLTDFVVVVSDWAKADALASVDVSVDVRDIGTSNEYVGLASAVEIHDHGISTDSVSYMSINYFNHKKSYNSKQNYNSIADLIIVASDYAKASDLITIEFIIGVNDFGITSESVHISSDYLFKDNGLARDSVAVKSVANYNSRKSYNKKWDAGGASYNSYKHHIVMVADGGVGVDLVNLSFDELVFRDSGSSVDFISVLPVILDFSDKAMAMDAMSMNSSVMVADAGVGVDLVNQLLDFPASKFFFVTTDDILEPLGVLVTRDSRHELLPSTRDSTEEIPGRHGEMDFGTEFNARIMELHIATDEGNDSLEKAHLQRLFARYLDPTKGAKTLIFSDDIEKSYMVKYSGQIDITNYATWFEFVLPFKMSNPFINGSFEKTLIGSGKLVNEGTFETGLIVEITGPIANPSVTIGGEVLRYTGAIPSGQRLIIDTDKETARIGSNNAIGDYNGAFPMLYPGETSVITSSSVTIKWRDKWI